MAYCCPYRGDTDIELVPVADGAKFDVRPQLKHGTFRILSGNRIIETMEEMMKVAEEHACLPYAYCHSCTAEFDFRGLDEDDYQEEE